MDYALLTLAQVAERLAVSEQTVRRLAASGELQRVRIRRAARYSARDVARLASQGTGLRERGVESAKSAS